MKLLIINGNGYSIFPPSGAWFFLSEQGFLTALSQSGALHKITTEKPDLEYLYFEAGAHLAHGRQRRLYHRIQEHLE